MLMHICVFGVYPQVDEVKSAAVFVEIVRVRDQNSELKERIRKYEAKLSEYQGAKRIIESLESKVSVCASIHFSPSFCVAFLCADLTVNVSLFPSDFAHARKALSECHFYTFSCRAMCR